MDGILVIDKPRGPTCQKILSVFRRAFPKEKAGYTGTLDPFATGVLPVFLGAATKLIPYINEGRKTYEALLRLGQSTETLDGTGKVTETSPVPSLDSKKVESVLNQFLGPRLQIPPRYSAVKIRGVPLYRYARKGMEVSPDPKPIEIYAIRLLEITPVTLRFVTEVSRGTYIRSLGAEIAQALGTVGHLLELRRLKSGPFDLQEAIEGDSLENEFEKNNVFQMVMDKTLRRVLNEFCSVELKNPDLVRRHLSGQTICLESEDLKESFKEGREVLTRHGDEILSISRYLLSSQDRKTYLKPLRILNLLCSNF
jgi:tRNA pseudouridine55 synthase